ncbi:glycosyl transferase family 1 [Neisseria meningitidis]|nr:glycosyl transferase family 1 [Neisseria meningitidis]
MPSERQAHRAIRFHCKRMKSSKYSGLTKIRTRRRSRRQYR